MEERRHQLSVYASQLGIESYSFEFYEEGEEDVGGFC